MDDSRFYEELLGLKTPWKVEKVDLKLNEQRVEIWAGHAEGERWPCPECAARLPVYDHTPERVWRHLDTCQCQTVLHARLPRVQCPTHGVVQVRPAWAEPQSHFTLLFERFAIEVLKECDVTGACRILRLSWDEAWHLMDRAVLRGRARKQRTAPTRLGVDEKAIAKGHKYLTLVCDVDAGTVEYIGDDRKQESLIAYYATLSDVQKTAIEAVAMDMWEPYVQATLAQIPDAARKIVFDRFHIMQHLGKAVDAVRKHEHRTLMQRGDETLKRSKYLWLYSRENVPETRRAEFAALRHQDLKVARAWAIKEHLRRLWSFVSEGWARRFWRAWHWWATHSRLQPIREAAALVKRHLANILTYCRHRITNAVSEGLNGKIQTIKKMAYGFRNPEHFKTAIYFHCGGLDLSPTLP
jgi:transposase